MSRLRLPCIECGGFGRITVGRPNDPYAALYVCEPCEGSGDSRCEAAHCNEVATDAVVIGRNAMPMCAHHMELWRADQEVEQ